MKFQVDSEDVVRDILNCIRMLWQFGVPTRIPKAAWLLLYVRKRDQVLLLRQRQFYIKRSIQHQRLDKYCHKQSKQQSKLWLRAATFVDRLKPQQKTYK